MRPGFFLDIADNTGDGFSYRILPAADYSDILLGRRPVTLIYGVVSVRDLDSPLEPHCWQSKNGLLFYNRKEDELVGNTELIQLPGPLPLPPNHSPSEEPSPTRL